MKDNIVIVLDTSNYKKSYSEEIPFKAIVLNKYENEILVKSIVTCKEYELYYSQILECLDIDEIFKSTSEAGRILNIPAQAISRVCRGEREKTHNKKFKYIQ